jgi:hypothetical protein
MDRPRRAAIAGLAWRREPREPPREALRYVLDKTVASALVRAEPGPSSRLRQSS